MIKSLKLTSVVSKYALDLFALLNFIFLSSTGLLLHYVLPHGSRHFQSPGGTRHGVTTLWGMDRHEWGEIHLILSFAFLGACFLHLIQHWKWIKGVFMVKLNAPSKVLSLSIIVLSLTAATIPFLSKTEVVYPQTNGSLQENTQFSKSNINIQQKEFFVRGGDTIRNIAEALQVSPCCIKRTLAIDNNTPNTIIMREVKDTLGISMSIVRQKLGNLKSKENYHYSGISANSLID
ncbi:MAG: DUF4405 domain-containing protein [Planctomycetes bacterium]|nr:DUF4405 domain-containing protein [Planctomycetota bacterium]